MQNGLKCFIRGQVLIKQVMTGTLLQSKGRSLHEKRIFMTLKTGHKGRHNLKIIHSLMSDNVAGHENQKFYEK